MLITDIILVGGGITGGALACALGQQGLKVALIDQQDLLAVSGPDGKSFTLSQSSVALFSQLGIWEKLTEVTPITTIHTSDGTRPAWVEYTEEDLKIGPLGYVVDSSLLKSTLQAHLLSCKNITIHAPATIVSFDRTPTHVRVETSQGVTFKAPLCIASDGRFSALRERVQIPLFKWAYDQTAIVCNMAHTLPHENRAFEHFLPSGPLAFVPRSGNTSGLVWSIETEKAASLLALSPEEFAKEVQSFFGSSLGTFTLAGPRWSYPLDVCLPKRLIDQRFALVGDAAHSFHPVAGQGLNVGLRDVATFSEILGEALSLGLDLGSFPVLERYQKRRRPDIFSMTFLTDGFVRVFSTQNRLMAHARCLGFGFVKNCKPLKNLMMRHGTGV